MNIHIDEGPEEHSLNAVFSASQLDLFYNTNHLSAAELKERRKDAEGQCKIILDFFKGNAQGVFTPFEVQMYAGMVKTPITSIRRALNTLTAAGKIVKTEIMRNGEYGVRNHTWKLALLLNIYFLL
jgi:hypothetical protein